MLSICCTVSIGSVIELAVHRHGRGRGDHGEQREHDEVDRQPQRLPFFTRLEALAVAGEVTEVEHRAGEVRHDQRDRAEHRADTAQPRQVLVGEVEVDVRSPTLTSM